MDKNIKMMQTYATFESSYKKLTQAIKGVEMDIIETNNLKKYKWYNMEVHFIKKIGFKKYLSVWNVRFIE